MKRKYKGYNIEVFELNGSWVWQVSKDGVLQQSVGGLRAQSTASNRATEWCDAHPIKQQEKKNGK